MAGIVKDKRKNSYFIRLSESESPTGKRVKIFCGGLKTKEEIKPIRTHIVKLIVAAQSKTVIPQETAVWLGQELLPKVVFE